MSAILLIPLGLCVCGKNIYYVKDTCAIAHDMPYCESFGKLDVIEFMQHVRAARETMELN